MIEIVDKFLEEDGVFVIYGIIDKKEKEIEEKEIKGKIREYKGVTYHDLKRRIKIFKIT